MRTQEEIIRNITAAKQSLDSVAMEIGQEYARYIHTKDEKLKIQINANVDVFQKLEARLVELDIELNS